MSPVRRVKAFGRRLRPSNGGGDTLIPSQRDSPPKPLTANRVLERSHCSCVESPSAPMPKADANRLCFLSDRRFGSFHRLRDLCHGGSRFRVGLSSRKSSLVHGLRTGAFLFGICCSSLPAGRGNSTAYIRFARLHNAAVSLFTPEIAEAKSFEAKKGERGSPSCSGAAGRRFGRPLCIEAVSLHSRWHCVTCTASTGP